MAFLATGGFLSAAPARAGEPVWSLSVRGGFIVPAQNDPSDWFDFTPVLWAGAGRRLGTHLSLLATTGYMRSPTPGAVVLDRHIYPLAEWTPGVGFNSVSTGTLVPLALGLRYSPMAPTTPLPRPYIEVSPALCWLHYEAYDVEWLAGRGYSRTNSSDDVLAAGGLFGLMVPGRITSRVGFEFGLSYWLTQRFEGERSFPGLNHWSMMGGLSFGL